ncbi:DUF58 domain-containing protein [Dactylosporangium fulvum]|uniref:DUF58 domain-containing protein n=1 Tax=Dactylosporangium fulvum TaxID=53359 RepID=A0ABY5VXG5_9ACTN|nr:DUF58 domain-containing protein [Dactylosporangium fulvum]UWP81816.1 DUF58 domain-containing protein [Dactylosporangium fulvum]
MITWRPPALLAVGTLLLALFGATLGSGVSPVWLWVAAGVLVLAIGVAALLDGLAAASPSELRMSRSGDKSLWLGESGSVRLILHNGSNRVFVGQVRDAWVPSAGATPATQEVRIEPGRAVAVTTSLTPRRRGDRPAVRVTARAYGPLRLAYRQSTRKTADRLTPEWRLRVYPRFSSRRILPEKLARLRVLDGSVVTRGRGQGTEFDTLREYVLGDDVRSIDWRGSARRSDVVVRTWRPERDRRLVCVLDTGRTSAARIGDEPRLDAAMDAAMLLASVAARADDRVDLLAVDTAVRASVTNVEKRTLLFRLVTAMAPLEPALVETDFGLVASEVLRRERKRALVVLFTALEPGALGDGLLPVLPQLAARHKVIVAAVHDPELTRMAQVGRTPSTADVYTAAAAQRALSERERVAAALRRHGVEVVDAPVDEFASRLTDHYLALKHSGRL